MSDREAAELRAVDWAVAAHALPGQAESGDLHVVETFEDGALLGVVDGLGHGPEAAVAARRAVAVLEARAEGPLPARFESCHDALRRTRGVVMSLASIDAPAARMTWAGIGNIDGTLVRANPGERPGSESLMLFGGVLGHQLPKVRPSELDIEPGDLLVLATDGISSGFRSALDPSVPPQEIADRVLAAHAKGTDDALVLVARLLPGE
jgi:serine phosphatase RsbU (regulator of sigma subunit)